MLEFYGIAPTHICARFAGNTLGAVEMVNSRGIYLELQGTRVLLCDASAGVVPNGAALENWQLLPGLLRVGQGVTVAGGFLQTQTCRCRLLLQEAACDTHIWLPEEGSLQRAQMLLESRQTETGLSPLIHPGKAYDNFYCIQARPHLEGLLEGLQTNAGEQILQCTQGLLGLGTGLTPSGDDVLSGLLYGLRHSPWREKPGVMAFLNCIQTGAPLRTNGVSADYLGALAQDAPFEKMAAAWNDPARYAQTLLTVGNNSGSEMLLGLVLAAKLILAQ